MDSILATKLQKLRLQNKAKAAAVAKPNKAAPPAADLLKRFDKIEKALDALTKKTLSKKNLDTSPTLPALANYSSCRAQKWKLASLEKDGREEEGWEGKRPQKAPKEKRRKEGENRWEKKGQVDVNSLLRCEDFVSGDAVPNSILKCDFDEIVKYMHAKGVSRKFNTLLAEVFIQQDVHLPEQFKYLLSLNWKFMFHNPPKKDMVTDAYDKLTNTVQ